MGNVIIREFLAGVPVDYTIISEFFPALKESITEAEDDKDYDIIMEVRKGKEECDVELTLKRRKKEKQ